jgi:hypothetical protein
VIETTVECLGCSTKFNAANRPHGWLCRRCGSTQQAQGTGTGFGEGTEAFSSPGLATPTADPSAKE